jgi:hypothetical protein
MVRPSELESPTPTMSRWCSNQLSYGRTEITLSLSPKAARMITMPPGICKRFLC